MQIVSSSLLGLTFQCAKCHDHKFEPITQRDYYQLQAVFYPAFDIKRWLKPNERFVYANLPGEREQWEQQSRETSEQIAALRRDFAAWAKANSLPSTTLFRDEFDDVGPPLAERWSATAPGDDTPGGAPPVALDSSVAPSAIRERGALAIHEGGGAGDRWLSTRQSFDWTPEDEGQWVQVTFDLVAAQLDGGKSAERIGYFIALHDFDDSGTVRGGNILIDGNPAGGAAVHLDYPGANASSAGSLGGAVYAPGHNYGVRVTNVGKDKFLLEHLVDQLAEDKTLTLRAKDLPNGGFGFEYCCGRSFVVDNVEVAQSATGTPMSDVAAGALRAKREELARAIKACEQALGERPGKIASLVEQIDPPSDVFLLERGNPATPGEKVLPAPVTALTDGQPTFDVRPPSTGASSSGRRLAWAQWLTRAGGRPAALLARVTVNRIWQHHFGAGLVRTPENLGTSGAAPSHPELLEYLASRFVESAWSVKAMHRLMLNSAAYRRTSALDQASFQADPENRMLWRYPVSRLDAEALRDAMLSVSGQLDSRIGGPYVPTTRSDQGEVLVQAGGPDRRRSLYLQQRRTQTLSFLNVFDAPAIVFNCVERPISTMPLQSLSLLNSDFAVTQADHFAQRLIREAAPEGEARVARAFLLAIGRQPSAAETAMAIEFVASQRAHHGDEAGSKEWSDFCQMLFASNLFLYVE
jgi:Protein of unknown function (DUF1553)/Protein of unknown function (DUF1549)